MLEKFHVPEDIEVRVRVEDLRWTAEELLKSTGMPEDDAVQTADVLVYADVRGVETHGVSNMLRVYVKQLQDGDINPTPDWKIVQDNKATCVIDGDGGHGMVISPIGMKEAIRRASEYGVGAVSVMNCRHLGPCSYYAEMAREQNMLGMATTTGGMAMVPTFGTKPLLGLNAMSFAAPTGQNPPFVYDASPQRRGRQQDHPRQEAGSDGAARVDHRRGRRTHHGGVGDPREVHDAPRRLHQGGRLPEGLRLLDDL